MPETALMPDAHTLPGNLALLLKPCSVRGELPTRAAAVVEDGKTIAVGAGGTRGWRGDPVSSLDALPP
jgi:hypothetical protein